MKKTGRHKERKRKEEMEKYFRNGREPRIFVP
jgi:hypothetical protein